MDRTLIKLWNETVSNDDEIFILGDFMMTQNADKVCACLKQLNGQKHLIVGNHDNYLSKHEERFTKIFLSISKQKILEIEGKKLVLTHRPQFSYEDCTAGDCWFLFGHIHNNGPQNAVCQLMPNNLNVGMDCCNYRPISFAEVKSRIEKKNRQLYDERYIKIASAVNECLPEGVQAVLKNC